MLDIDTIERVALEVRAQLHPGVMPDAAVSFARLRDNVTIDGLCGPYVTRARGCSGLPGRSYASLVFDAARGEAWLWLHREAWTELAAEVPRSRFSAAHDVSHVAVHADQLSDLDEPAERDHDELLDAEANRLGAHLLIPDQGLLGLWRGGKLPSVDAIAARYGVSKVTATRRIDEWLRSRS